MAKERSEIWEWIKALFIAIILAFIIRTFFLTPIVVDGASMEPTLHHAKYPQNVVNESNDFIYLEPKLKGVVKYRNLTKKGFLRIPSFKHWTE